MSERRTPRTSPRTRRPGKRALLDRDVTHVDYKDVALLRTFISDRGKVRARRITGVTPRQQRLITKAVKNAREMALLPCSSR